MSRTVLYARVSTLDQTAEHQATQARLAGFQIDEVVADEGQSGVTTRLAERPQGRRLKDLLREGDTLVVRWLDRLGRNYEDVTETVKDFIARGVVIRTVINTMTFDGTAKDPMQKAVRDAMLAFMAAMAQAQAEATKEAQRAGIAHAKASGSQYIGRKPSYSREQFKLASELLGQGKSPSEVAKATGLSRGTVYRIKDDPAEGEKALALWGL